MLGLLVAWLACGAIVVGFHRDRIGLLTAALLPLVLVWAVLFLGRVLGDKLEQFLDWIYDRAG